MIGALYLDGGLPPVRAFAVRAFGDALEQGPPDDPKTSFQEWAHANLRTTPRYATIGDTGGEEDEARFTVEVSVDGRVWGSGVGRSKRAAEREAALRALEAVERRDG